MKKIMTSYDNVVKELKADFDLTESWVDIGDRINTKGQANLALWLRGDLETSDVAQFRFKCFKDPSDDNAFYPQIQVIGTATVALSGESYNIDTSTINLVTPLGFSNLVPFIQLEMKVNVAGLTPAHIDEALISFDRKPA